LHALCSPLAPSPLFGFQYSNGQQGGEYVSLTLADNGEASSYYPPDGVGSAILDGGCTQGQSGTNVNGLVVGGPANGIGCAFAASNADNVTIIGLQFQRYAWSPFWQNSDNLTFKYNIVHDLTSASFELAVLESPVARIRKF
jgi:hypothetical protein